MAVNTDVTKLAKLVNLALKALTSWRTNALTFKLRLKTSITDGIAQLNWPSGGATLPVGAEGDMAHRNNVLYRFISGAWQTMYDGYSCALATLAELQAGTDTNMRVITSALFLAGVKHHALIPYTVAVSDETTDLAQGTAKVTFRAPFACTVVQVRASQTAGGTTQATVYDVKEGGASIFGTNKLSVPAGAKTSVGATPPVDLNDTSWADDAEITIDITQVATGAKGGKITFMLRRT